VGETPKAGIQKAVFRETLDLIADLQGVAADPTVALLGPTYSGSVGCGVPCGGMARTLSFLRTRSQVAACGSRSSRLGDSRFTGSLAGCGLRVLWQPTQYLFSQARCVAAAVGAAGFGPTCLSTVALAEVDARTWLAASIGGTNMAASKRFVITRSPDQPISK